MLNPEKQMPYDRTLLSKALPTIDSEKTVLRSESYLKEADIDVVKSKVYAIHTDKKLITLEKGKPLNYDKLVIATGCDPFLLPIEGIDAKGVHTLRSAKDQTKLKEKLSQVKDSIVIIGSGLIGSEVAASIKSHYKS